MKKNILTKSSGLNIVFIAVFSLIFTSADIKSQNSQEDNPLMIQNPYLVPPTPEVASFLRYGEYTISHNTGIPDISIPIYTIQTGKLTYPITLSYYAGGIKVNDLASWVGLGWTLNSGGAINLSIMDMPDNINTQLRTEEYIRSNNNYGYLYSKSLQRPLSDFVRDKMQDRYDYSFNNNSGSFVIGDTKKLDTKTILQFPLTDNKIIRNNDDTFCIITSDGTSYYFTAPEETKVRSWSVDNKGGGSANQEAYRHKSAWYLTKIVSFDRTDSIQFIYEQRSTNYEDVYLSQQATAKRINKQSEAIPVLDYLITNSITVRNQLVTQILKEIRFNEGKIIFEHKNDRPSSDCREYRLSQISVLNNIDSKSLKKITFENTFETSRLILKSISFLGNDDRIYDKYTFSYYSGGFPNYLKSNNLPSPSLSTSIVNSYYKQDELGYLNGKQNYSLLSFMPEQSVNLYKNCIANRSFNFASARSGTLEKIEYITGGSTQFIYDSSPGEECRSPALRIKEIISKNSPNESKASVHKIYNYKEVSQAGYPNSIFGGTNPFVLCPSVNSKISNCDRNSYDLITENGYSSSYVISGYENLKTFRYDNVEEIMKSDNYEIKTVYEYEKFEPLFEFVQSSNRLTLQFSPMCILNLYQSIPALDPKHMSLFLITALTSRTPSGYIIDTDWKKPQLLKKTVYRYSNNAYRPMEITTNKYSYYKVDDKVPVGLGIHPLLTTFQGTDQYCSGGLAFKALLYDWAYTQCPSISNYLFYNIYRSTGWKKLVETKIENLEENAPKQAVSKVDRWTYGSIEKTTNSHPFITNYVEELGAEEKREYKFTYPSDLSGNETYIKMIEKNIISPTIIKESNYINLSSINTFIKQENKYNSSFLPEQISQYTERSIGGTVESKATVQLKTTYAPKTNNPIEIVDASDFKTVCVWNGEGQLIAEIKNASLDDVSKAIGINSVPQKEFASTGCLSYDQIQVLKGSLSNAYITTYKYLTLVGVNEVTDPAGNTIYYEYDSTGRLKAKYIEEDGSKVMLESYEYRLEKQ